jgi:hypothetical protein
LAGLRASSIEGRGAEGWSTKAEGLVGISVEGAGVYGTGTGVAGVVGDSETGGGIGVEGRSGSNAGVLGTSQSWRGVDGRSTDNAGVFGSGKFGGWFEGSFEGVHAVSHNPGAAGVAGFNDRTGPGIFGKSVGGPAGYFEGNVVVTGDISLTNGDIAEEFDMVGSERVEPGTVMVLAVEGALVASSSAYDKRVAGVISGAGDYKPALVLDKRKSAANRQTIALTGKVFCKVDASFGSIAVGDLLTSSATLGHAMRVSEPFRAFGAVIGKALRPLTEGQGLIPILIALQ